MNFYNSNKKMFRTQSEEKQGNSTGGELHATLMEIARHCSVRTYAVVVGLATTVLGPTAQQQSGQVINLLNQERQHQTAEILCTAEQQAD